MSWTTSTCLRLVLAAALVIISIARVDADSCDGKRILFVDSYNEGYEWSDGVLRGVKAVLGGTGVTLRIFRMDAKLHPSDNSQMEAALNAGKVIEEFKPDVLIASDDSASKYLVMPYLRDAALPVVFCGINWDASIYGYPYKNTTGMVEVDLVDQMVELLRPYAQGDRMGYLSVTSLSERKITRIYNKRFFHGRMKVYLVKTYDEFKRAFLKAQEEVDMLHVSNYAGIDRWDHDEAAAFVLNHTRIPTGARLPWMKPFALITLAKVPEEQGIWAASTALRILRGTPPSSIPIVKNKRARLVINMKMAKRLGIVFEPAVLETAEIFGLE